MSSKEVRAFRAICCGCSSARCFYCMCRLQTLVKVSNRRYDDSITGNEADSDWSGGATLSLPDSSLRVQSACCNFCQPSPDFSQRTDTEPPSSACAREENRSNLAAESNSDSGRLDIRSSSQGLSGSVEVLGPVHNSHAAQLLTMEFGSRKTFEAAVLVTSPAAASHLVATSEPAVGIAASSNTPIDGGQSDESKRTDSQFESEIAESGSGGRTTSEIPVEMEVAGQCGNSAESQTRLEKAYATHLEPSVRLHRTIADPLPELLDMRLVRRNFKLVKLRRHPMQVEAESHRLQDFGVSRLDQILRQRLELFHKKFLIKRAETPPDTTTNSPIVYPDWLSFRLRLMKQFSNTRWKLFVAHRRRQRSAEPNNIERRPNIQESHMYNPKYIDVWTTGLSVMVKNGALLRDVIGAAFARLGLDKRADFRYSVNCFLGDSRNISGQDGAQLIAPIEVFESTLVRQLYQLNATEIFLNDNKLSLFSRLPESVHGFPGYGELWNTEPEVEEPEEPKKKRCGCCRRK